MNKYVLKIILFIYSLNINYIIFFINNLKKYFLYIDIIYIPVYILYKNEKKFNIPIYRGLDVKIRPTYISNTP
jgi:hypothetical protein